MNTTYKLLGAVALFASMGAANAAPFYIDNGVNFQPDTTTPSKVNATSTSLKNEMTLKYQSSTDFNFGGNGVLNAGDSFVTKGGLAVGNIFENAITGLNPSQGLFGLGFADNGFNTNWQLSFSFTDLQGTVSSLVGGFPLLDYTSGTINFLYTTNGTTFTNFMDLIVTGSALAVAGAPNLALFGNIDFTTVDNLTYANLFHSADGISFYDAWLAGGSAALTFNVDQNTNPAASVLAPLVNGVRITSNHDGSVTFSTVPEPATLALLGLGLIGLGAFSGRKADKASILG